jgi:hypothetical protein
MWARAIEFVSGLIPGTVVRGGAAHFVGVRVRPVVGTPLVNSRERGLTGVVAFPLIAIEVRVKVVEEGRGSSSSADIDDCHHGEDGDDDQGHDSNKELEVRQLGGHGDLLSLDYLRRPDKIARPHGKQEKYELVSSGKDVQNFKVP